MRNAKAFLAFVCLVASSCATHRPPPLRPAAEILSTPNPIPKVEPRAALGNPPFYDVLGKRYFVLASAAGFAERGVASWYGPGFHKELTSTGDRYDMYAMTAAHKTLPLPCYARVTNLKNGLSIIVRINDRGPFKDDRIIDLSYTAASKLDMIRDGTALVELQVVGADGGPAPPIAAPTGGPLYVQAGAFGDEANAARVLARLKNAGLAHAFIRNDPRNLHRVRIGPIDSVEEFDRVVQQLRALGISDARLATEESP